MAKSAKVDSLPDDLRGIAQAMLRKKFGHEIFCSKDKVCEDCSNKFCDDCRAPYDQFTQIDHDMCRVCYDDMQWERGKEQTTNEKIDAKISKLSDEELKYRKIYDVLYTSMVSEDSAPLTLESMQQAKYKMILKPRAYGAGSFNRICGRYYDMYVMDDFYE